MIDLPVDQLDEVRDILASVVPGCEVRAFGSRVDGRAARFSDLDLVVVGPGGGAVPNGSIQALKDAFSGSDLPILVDVHDWSELSESFRAAIENACETVQQPRS